MGKIKTKKEANISLIITLIVIMSLFYFSAADAVELNVNLPKSSIEEDKKISFIASVDIGDNERIPVKNLSIIIGGNKCTFSPDGSKISGSLCSSIVISRLSTPDYNLDTGFGYGYGVKGGLYGYYNQTYPYGYGYGGATYSKTSFPYGDLSYNITWTAPSVSSDKTYEITFVASNDYLSYETKHTTEITVKNKAEESSESSSSSGTSTSTGAGEFLFTSMNLEPEPIRHMINIDKPDIALDGIYFSIGVNLKDHKIKVKRLYSVPENITKLHKVVYQFLKIDFNLEDDKVIFADLKFKMPKKWIKYNNFTADDIALYRLHDGQWNELNTTLLNEDEQYYYYSARTPGFSLFAIAVKNTEFLFESATGSKEKSEQASGSSQIPPESSPQPTSNAIVEQPSSQSKEESNSLWICLFVLLLIIMVVFILLKRRNKHL